MNWKALFVITVALAVFAELFILDRPQMYYDAARGPETGCLYYLVENPKNGEPMKMACDKVAWLEKKIAEKIPAK